MIEGLTLESSNHTIAVGNNRLESALDSLMLETGQPPNLFKVEIVSLICCLMPNSGVIHNCSFYSIHFTTDESQFTLTAVVKCTSVIQVPFPNRHFKMAALDLSSGICRALAQPIVASQAYTVSAEILNEAGWKGVNSGHPGLLFNAIDENNFDFVYLRYNCASVARCVA